MTEVLRPKLPTLCRYLALEPSQDFVDVLNSATKHMGVETYLGRASSIPANRGTVRNVICAQSFHWFSDGKHLEEIHRVLVTGGQLILAIVYFVKHIR